jgi:hypothetical protein
VATSASRRPALATSPFKRPEVIPPTTDGFAEGDRVTLDRYGMGSVVKVTPEYVLVDFRDLGIRRIPPGTSGFSLL